MDEHAKVPHPGGRPSSYSIELTSKICERLVEGESLRSICREDGMPSLGTIFNWLDAHPEFLRQYARARELQADVYADEIVDIADDGRRDYTVDEDGRETVDHDHIARARLRVDSRKWTAAKLRPKKYGDRVNLNVGGQPDGAPIKHVLDTTDALEASRAYQEIIAES